MPVTEQNDRLDKASGRSPIVDQDKPDPQVDAMTSRLLRREALRRATEGMSTMTGPGLENALARLSAEVTEEAAYRHATAGGNANHAHAAAAPKLPGRA
jgi:hypothetical protein